MVEIALLFAILLFAYPFVLYPVLLRFLASRLPWPGRPPEANLAAPTVALVICALNEGRVIREKIENSLVLAYPPGRLRIIVISDGSTDNTAAIAREYQTQGIHLIERAERRGKIANLNDVIGSLSEEIIVLSDANVLYDTQALLRLLELFQDESIGCVSGRVILRNTAEPLASSEQNYYSLEWRLQEWASSLYAMVGADGAMYALRRELFSTCAPDTLIDDYVIPMSVANRGRRVVFQPRAIGWEDGPAGLGEEYRRKVRIAAGAAQALLRGTAYPKVPSLRLWFIFASHKLLRWLSPVSGVCVLVLALATWQHPLSRVVLIGFTALSVLALIRLSTGLRHVVLDSPFYFLFGQIAMAVGLWKGLLKRQSVLWAKANR
jgi:cellulose synthase/poly-beta-1,6-N-acetylglucosamine synthase-like glycosyltransferase